MTKPTQAAVAFRVFMAEARERSVKDTGRDWPEDLIAAGTRLRCELENVMAKNWRESGGPDRLARYTTEFEQLFEEWKSGDN